MAHDSHTLKLSIFADVEALEGYADALAEVGGLTPEHHKAIATKLALDLMEDLNIDEKERSDLLKKETAFIKDAEIAYVKSKRELSGGVGRYLELGIALTPLRDFQFQVLIRF